MTPLLDVRDAVKSYGAVRALNGASLTVEAAEVVALLGDNGAGKSTLIKAISGVAHARRGQHPRRGRRGRVPLAGGGADGAAIETLHQDLGLFDNLSAVANFRIGPRAARARAGSGVSRSCASARWRTTGTRSSSGSPSIASTPGRRSG